MLVCHNLVFLGGTSIWLLKSVSALCSEQTTDFLRIITVLLFFLPETSSGLNILVVIDTNIMISHLEFVKSLKSEDIPGM